MNEKQIQCETDKLKQFIHNLGIDIVGIANLQYLKDMPQGLPSNAENLFNNYKYAIVLGGQLGKWGQNISGNEASAYLEEAALEVISYLEEKACNYLIVHTEDEFDPVNRIGFLSLKVLAKAAGLGWQGRSLLIISPVYGPVHRWIAVLTNYELVADHELENQCRDCRICVDKCPVNALHYIPFSNHPLNREDVLDMNLCKGDKGCKICLIVCPWYNH